MDTSKIPMGCSETTKKKTKTRTRSLLLLVQQLSHTLLLVTSPEARTSESEATNIASRSTRNDRSATPTQFKSLKRNSKWVLWATTTWQQLKFLPTHRCRKRGGTKRGVETGCSYLWRLPGGRQEGNWMEEKSEWEVVWCFSCVSVLICLQRAMKKVSEWRNQKAKEKLEWGKRREEVGSAWVP